jgi:RNA polymerase sigma factor (sigma-70 family)
MAIERSLPWCRRVARKAWRKAPRSAGYEYDEMLAIAHLALVEAARAWENGRSGQYSLSFEAYACWRMKVAIYEAMRTGQLGGMRVLRYRGKVKTAFGVNYLDDPDEPLRLKVRDRFDLALERRDEVRKLLALVEPRSARIAWRTFGHGDLVADVAHREGISQARASQLRNEAVEVIREQAGGNDPVEPTNGTR